MGEFKVINLVFLFFTYKLVSNQMVSDKTTISQGDNSFECPLVDDVTVVDNKLIHNISRASSCTNGRRMAGCCVERFYCNYNTSEIDLTLFGPPGYKISCAIKEICCPQKYILPIPLFNSTKNHNGDSGDSGSSSSNDSDDD